MSLKTSYEFTLPRGYVDGDGVVHRNGVMRLATARDELDPLRDPRITGPDDPRLTILVLARVIEKLGTLELVGTNIIEGLFAVDLAFLQDFYGVINFGDQEEYDALISATRDRPLPGSAPPPPPAEPVAAVDPVAPGADDVGAGSGTGSEDELPGRPSLRAAVEEFSRRTS